MKYQYRLVVKGDHRLLKLSTILDDLGREGWELVAVDERYFYLKRPKS